MFTILFTPLLASSAFAQPTDRVRACAAEERLAPFAREAADVLGRLGAEDWRATEDHPLLLSAAEGYAYTVSTVVPADLPPFEAGQAYLMEMHHPSSSRRARIHAWLLRVIATVDRVLHGLRLVRSPAYVGGGSVDFRSQHAQAALHFAAHDPRAPVVRVGAAHAVTSIVDRRAEDELSQPITVVASLDSERPRRPSPRDARVFEALVRELTRAWPGIAFDVTMLVPAKTRAAILHVHAFHTNVPRREAH